MPVRVAEAGPELAVTVLLVSALPDDRRSLADIFSHTNWRLSFADTPGKAFDLLRQGKHAVVICDRDSHPGWWTDLLGRISALESPPFLVVATLRPDNQLWAEALNLGAYDVLSKPFDQREVLHVVSAAWQQWRSRERRQRCMSEDCELIASR